LDQIAEARDTFQEFRVRFPTSDLQRPLLRDVAEREYELGMYEDAMRGYKEIHLRALKLLERDGYLSTFSCSHHVTRDLFLQTINAASVDAKRALRLVQNHAQRADHPVLLSIPETEYLKGFTFQLPPPR
jgi:23S rRNA G2069 N7-methylase RlmK/C1962 C5-methylase RlmI